MWFIISTDFSFLSFSLSIHVQPPPCTTGSLHMVLCKGRMRSPECSSERLPAFSTPCFSSEACFRPLCPFAVRPSRWGRASGFPVLLQDCFLLPLWLDPKGGWARVSRNSSASKIRWYSASSFQTNFPVGKAPCLSKKCDHSHRQPHLFWAQVTSLVSVAEPVTLAHRGPA